MLSLPGHLVHARPVRWALMAGLLGALALAGVNAWVVLRADARVTSDVAQVPHAQAAIVPGAFVDARGGMSGMLADRVRRAVELYRAGKVDRVLVSGDHGRLGYDETDTMRDAVLEAGVPADRVFTDYAGFSTWATMRRAREVFGVDSAVVVTQPFHISRAVALGRAAGLDVHGLTVTGRYGRQGQLANAREVLARAKGFSEAVATPHVLLGPPHPITGDGRSSWGPRDPLAPLPG